jgi:hypothetical protein
VIQTLFVFGFSLRLVRWVIWVTSSVIMAWPTIFWLVSAWDYLTNSELVRENWRTFRFGCFSYVVQRRKNSFGNFLELSEYGGKGRRSYVIIPEGYEGKGWVEGRLQFTES